MPEPAPDSGQVMGPARGRRRRRRYLPPFIRYGIVMSWGALLAVAVFYLLRKLGF